MSVPFAEIVFWIAAAACTIAQIAILRVAFARPAIGDAPVSSQVPRSPRGVEILWAVIPSLALIGLFAATWRAIH
jgi:heme/copper-type cytochrome/quinol oxidase subunit 2